MTELVTAAQMKAIEAAAIASGAVTGLELMERAGRGVVEAVFAEWPELAAGSFRAVLLCGPGGNGGDGFVVARLLKEWGWEVEVYLYGDPARMPADARVNYERWLGMGEVHASPPVEPAVSLGVFEHLVNLESPVLLVDALFGIGLMRPLEKRNSLFDMAFRNMMTKPMVRRVAIDLPSGICSDSGRKLGHAFYADLTVTFHAPKAGHFMAAAMDHCGKLQVVDLELDPDVNPTLEFTETPLGVNKWSGHKYSHGHALILSGPSGRGGAARLAARGALRIGAGVVTVACPAEALAENAARLDAVMLRVVEDGAGLGAILADARIIALCIGPGLGVARAGEVLRVALASGRSMVIDADGITALSQDAGLFAALHEDCVLTPHAGEFARLFPDLAEKLAEPATQGPAYSKVDATREAAARAGCVVLYKGADTVLAGPDGRCAVNAAVYERSAPWLATAGSGDVLAGFITGLLARGFAPFDAACAGAWLHVECARSFGPGLIAEDLPEQLPKVFRQLGV